MGHLKLGLLKVAHHQPNKCLSWTPMGQVLLRLPAQWIRPITPPGFHRMVFKSFSRCTSRNRWGLGAMADDHRNATVNVDAGKADRSVWLMKCPHIVSKAWQSSSASGASRTLAKVVVSLDPLQSDDSSAIQFTMEMCGNEVVNTPKGYSLNMSKDFVPMCVFSETKQGKLAAEGKVEHKFDMKPHDRNIEEYRKMCRERTNKSMFRNRQIQVIDNDRGVHLRPLPGVMSFSTSVNKEKRKTAPVKASEVKRTRRDRGELEAIMFKLFEKQPNWALKQLVQETHQPPQFLKEVLSELCMYNKRGSNQGTYELKPEYRKSVADIDAE